MAASSAVKDCPLWRLPQELRDDIYSYLSQRPEGSTLLIKQYLEKIDPDIPNVETLATQAVPAAVGVDTDGGAEEADDGEESFEEQQEDADEDSLADLGTNGEDVAFGEHDDSNAEEVIGRFTKYRHSLDMFKVDRCPPPISVLASCKQISQEATQLHRNQCTLTIDICKGFQHHSFFEETIEKLTNAPYSPLEQIRKIHLIFTWDTELLSEASGQDAIGRALSVQDMDEPPLIDPEQVWFLYFYLGQRMELINNLIKACPELRNLTIEYHDTEDTIESRVAMTSNLLDIRATIGEKVWQLRDPETGEVLAYNAVELEVKDFFSQADTDHDPDSKLGLFRAEIVDLINEDFEMR